MNFQHVPVMLNEVAAFLAPQRGGTFVDCTLGGGGHVKALLQPSPANPKPSPLSQGERVFAFDQDVDAIEAAKRNLAQFNNITYIQDNFRNLKKHIKEPINGILFDLGVSSWQIDEPSRGFSLQKDGPLDMRMDKRQKLDAAAIINHYDPDDLAKIFFEFGEERFFRRIAKAIVSYRESHPIRTTFELKAIVEKATPGWRKRETLSRIFQSLRIAVNQELECLHTALEDAIDLLSPSGRIVVLSYHSLEDRIVKQTFKHAGQLKILTKKPVTATEEEVNLNPRAKSAKLRAAEKVG
ncbi:MAG: 16S rRNA (cytosine(1402)-N(4))-methyltransferase RsmH [Candidatus Margulisbacteria bacterium]|nr:16S rRNA (cytosine(1402)-N(4))-methyltransferase RsmH [Candidatus Margulisiibacteriota bacterium]